ncbi:MAG: DUF748 domain-containing protein [Mariprofundales bacterium]|nr:DUF748 domain-containing protein [Mariprofundales bacterium]
MTTLLAAKLFAMASVMRMPRSLAMRKIALALSILLITLLLLWQLQGRVAAQALAQQLPALHYRAVNLHILSGQLVIHGVQYRLPGLIVSGGDVTVDFNPFTLLQGTPDLKQVTIDDLHATVTPTQLNMDSSSTVAAVPPKLLLHHATVDIQHESLPHMRPLNIDGEAVLLRDGGWRLKSSVTLPQGAVHGTGQLKGGLLHGSIAIEDSTLHALLQQIGTPESGSELQGRIAAQLTIQLPLSTPEDIDIKGEWHIDEAALQVQGSQQQIGSVRVDMSWQGGERTLTLHHVDLERVAWHWSSGRVDRAELLPPPKLQGLHWQLERLSIAGGSVDIHIPTAAGTAHLPLQLQRLDLQTISWRNPWPKSLKIQANMGRGRIALSLQGSDAKLELQSIAVNTFEPIVMSATALPLPRGRLNLQLAGNLTPKLKLFGEATVKHLVLAPRIPVPGVDLAIPVRFGLRALTNDHGVTHIPLMISGTIAKPDFKRGMIMSAIKKNMLNKALDGGFKHYAVGFHADRKLNGQRLTPTGTKTLTKLIYILQHHPDLRIVMRGCVDSRTSIGKKRAQKLAAARVGVVRRLLHHHLHRDVVDRVIYPALTAPSPDLKGKKDRVEVTIYPRR